MKRKEVTTLENAQSYALETDNKNYGSKNEELVRKEEFENGLFSIVTGENGSFIAIANMRVSELFKDKEVLIEKIENKDWNLIVNVILSMITMNEEIEKLNITQND